MHVVDVAPKDIHILMDFSMKDLIYLKQILNNMTFDFDSNVPEQQAAADFLNNTFYPTINDTIEDLTNGS